MPFRLLLGPYSVKLFGKLSAILRGIISSSILDDLSVSFCRLFWAIYAIIRRSNTLTLSLLACILAIATANSVHRSILHSFLRNSLYLQRIWRSIAMGTNQIPTGVDEMSIRSRRCSLPIATFVFRRLPRPFPFSSNGIDRRARHKRRNAKIRFGCVNLRDVIALS